MVKKQKSSIHGIVMICVYMYSNSYTCVAHAVELTQEQNIFTLVISICTLTNGEPRAAGLPELLYDLFFQRRGTRREACLEWEAGDVSGISAHRRIWLLSSSNSKEVHTFYLFPNER